MRFNCDENLERKTDKLGNKLWQNHEMQMIASSEVEWSETFSTDYVVRKSFENT